MKDTIYRQQAIDAINTWLELYVLNHTMSDTMSIQDMLRALPSAQPETHDKRTETHACDLISRQAAIDAVVSAMIDGADAELVEGIMELLPSAQPERKNGRWIRNDNGTYSCSVCQSWIPEQQHCYARYCLYCGADMRGENDEGLD